MKKNILYIAIAAALGFTACQPEIDSPISKGSEIDLTKYVAVGNSLTAGYMDGGLYNEAIEASYPNLIAKQFKLVGGGDFVQAYFPEGKENGSGYFKITGFDSNGIPIVGTETNNLATTGQTLPGGAQLTAYSGPLPNNLGIPGIAVAHLQNAAYSQANPFFERLKPGTPTSYIDLVGEASPTFFTCWIGNNDVLGFVTSGGSGTITPSATFQANYQALIDKLTENGAKGIIADIPNVTSIPYVYAPNTLIRQQNGGNFPVIPIPNAATAAAFNAAYQAAGYSNPNFVAGNNFPVIVVDDPSTPTVIEVRKMNPSQDLLLYHFLNPANPTGYAGQIATGLGWMSDTDSDNVPDTPTPIADRDVLDQGELAQAIAAVTTFNTIIQQIASAKNIPVINSNSYLLQVLSGAGIEGVQVNGNPFSGGFFSIDQVHPTPKGYAILANIFLRRINQAYNANIPLIDINGMNPRGVKFP
ncbi:lysophospholipase L1-like esterase [Thermonema lapsum]|uniref:Lysophospholipase L1-like esterase n=1 Tax=Thermonema lapsum TaxID=28195 RepID=A0A846MSG3_9BACT|nr:SGNH/GDSL hydrolase family protein [Thermonema lapsum]NIK74536.1 lysophospholipase L1-like esterase [Thermonema lapsum]